MNTMTRILSFIVAVVVLAFCSPALADLIVGDGFSYSDGGLAGNNGGTAGAGSSWSSVWTHGDYAPHVVNGGQVVTDDEHSYSYRGLSTNFAGSNTVPLYFSVLLTSNKQDQAFAWWMSLTNSIEENNKAVIGVADGKLSVRIKDTVSEVSGDFGVYTPGEQLLLVGKLEFDVDGSNDRLQMWVNPTGEETASIVSSQVTTTGGGVGWAAPGYVTIRNWAMPAGNGLMDDVKVGSSWGDVAPVPEPCTAMLLATGLIGLLAYAWRKRK